MNNFLIDLTLMVDSKKIRVNIRDILAFKDIVLGSGCIVFLRKRIQGRDTLIVNESQSDINNLINDSRLNISDAAVSLQSSGGQIPIPVDNRCER